MRRRKRATARRNRRAIEVHDAEAPVEQYTPPAFADNSLPRPFGGRDLVPLFMMIETDLFQRLNDKATARHTGYDMLLRTILRDHISEYTATQPPRRKEGASTRRRRGTK